MENKLEKELKCEVCGEPMIFDGRDDFHVSYIFVRNFYHCDNCDCCCVEYEKEYKPIKRFWRADNFGFGEEWVEYIGENENEKK